MRLVRDITQEEKLASLLEEVIENRAQLFKKAKEVGPLAEKVAKIKFSSPAIPFTELQASWNSEQAVKDKQAESAALDTAAATNDERISAFLPDTLHEHLKKTPRAYLVVKRADNSFYALFFFEKHFAASWSNSAVGLADAMQKFKAANTPPGPAFMDVVYSR